MTEKMKICRDNKKFCASNLKDLSRAFNEILNARVQFLKESEVVTVESFSNELIRSHCAQVF